VSVRHDSLLEAIVSSGTSSTHDAGEGIETDSHSSVFAASSANMDKILFSPAVPHTSSDIDCLEPVRLSPLSTSQLR